MQAVVIDYRMGNLASVCNMLRKIGIAATISADPDVIAAADKFILPGVGSFDHGMRSLHDLNLVPVLQEKVLNQHTPILGICLGMQLMTTCSEEGSMQGLGWVKAETKRFRFPPNETKLKIPHMGWNTVKSYKESSLFDGIGNEPRFYFVHSYHVCCHDESDILTTSHHGYDFVSSIEKENIVGVQFHPEKSHRFGMTFLRNWALNHSPC